MAEFEIQSELAVEPVAVWSAASLESVNWELAPIARMTAPKEWKHRPIASWEVRSELFKSWILLLGVLPIDRHSFRIEQIVCGSGFRERSSSWINRQWNHDRTVVPRDRGCAVIDHVAVIVRVRILAPLLMPVYRFIFSHRHRRLRKKYGTIGK